MSEYTNFFVAYEIQGLMQITKGYFVLALKLPIRNNELQPQIDTAIKNKYGVVHNYTITALNTLPTITNEETI